VNRFHIRSNWKPRVEAPEELGVRTLRSLDSISALSPLFRDWIFLDLFRDPFEMTEENIGEFLFPLEKVRSQISEIVKRGARKDDFGGHDPRGGYGISVSNSNVSDAERVKFSAHGGALVSWIRIVTLSQILRSSHIRCSNPFCWRSCRPGMLTSRRLSRPIWCVCGKVRYLPSVTCRGWSICRRRWRRGS